METSTESGAESRRLEELRAHQILDTSPEQAYDELVALAAEISNPSAQHS